jgi:hypothetical protein
MAEETQTPQNNAALAAAFNTVTPYEQIRLGSAFEKGQYDFSVLDLKPGTDKNGLYTITVVLKALAPSTIASLPGKGSEFIRTLYIGTHKDKMAEQPDTRLNSPGLRCLKAIAEANKLPTNNQSDAQMCSQLLGKQFGVALVEGKPYETNEIDPATGKKKMKPGGLEFGRTFSPAGTLPAKLEREAASASATATQSAVTQGATF